MEHSPVVKGEKAQWYAKNYYTVEDDIQNIFERMDTPFLDKRIKPDMTILDAMMGRGRHAIRYAKRGCVVHGNDLNPHMVAIARKSARAMRLNSRRITFSALDARHLKGIKKNHYDVSFAMFSAIGTVPDSKNRQMIFDAMARCTKKSGIVIVHAHNRLDTFFKAGFMSWAWRTTLFPERNLETGDMIADYNGLHDMFNHFYTPREFRKSFEDAGLEVIEEHYMDYATLKFITGSLRKLKADGFIFVGKKI